MLFAIEKKYGSGYGPFLSFHLACRPLPPLWTDDREHTKPPLSLSLPERDQVVAGSSGQNVLSVTRLSFSLIWVCILLIFFHIVVFLLLWFLNGLNYRPNRTAAENCLR
jgi:hypothetical protein